MREEVFLTKCEIIFKRNLDNALNGKFIEVIIKKVRSLYVFHRNEEISCNVV